MRSPQAAHVGLERRLRRALAHDREHDVGFVTKAVGRFDQRPQRLRQAHVARVHHDEPVVPPPLGPEHRRPLERSHHRAVRPVVDRRDAMTGHAELEQPSVHVPADRDHTVRAAEQRPGQASRAPNDADRRDDRGRPPPLGTRPCSPRRRGRARASRSSADSPTAGGSVSATTTSGRSTRSAPTSCRR